MSAHEDIRFALGAYALGTLEPAEQHSVETHLATCPTCLAELDELIAVVPPLASLTAADIAAPEPSPELFDRIARAVEPASVTRLPARGRSRRRLLAVAASVLVLAGAGTAIGVVATSTHSAQSTNFSASAGSIRLTGAATDISAGTRLTLTVRGLPHQERCHLVALAVDGTLHDAGTWDANYDGHAMVVEHTDVARSHLRTLTLYGTAGNELLAVTL